MAKAEFYEITIRNTDDEDKNLYNIIEIIKNKLFNLSDTEKLCNKKTCRAVLSEFIENENSATFDFSKLTHEIVNSATVSKPLDTIDTFKEFNEKIADTKKPTEKVNNTFILIFQKAVHGFDVEHLLDYFNTHLLINENFKLYFKKIYDASFMDMLQNSELKTFRFTFGTKQNSILEENELVHPLKAILDNLGSNKIIVSSENENGNALDNKQLLNFFEMASEAGLLDNCELKEQKSRKFINARAKGLELNYTRSYKVDNINVANEFFIDAFENREDIIQERIK